MVGVELTGAAPIRTAGADNSASRRAWSRITVAVVVLGVGLRIAQWLGNPSLWLDELQLVGSIAGRGMLELLLQGLDRSQVAPVGFLVPTKAVTLAVGNGEPALRAVAVAASILALIVFWRLIRSLLVTAESFHGDPPRCRRPRWPTASSPYRLPLLPALIRERDSGSP